MEQLKSRLRGDTGRLTLLYLAVIMGMTIIFSGVIYSISSSQFDRPLPPENRMQFDDISRSDLQALFDRRADEARGELLMSLIVLNVAVLVSGSVVSYYLARKSLEPIEAAMEAQSRFVSDASHELRTPLAALQVTNEVALRKKKLSLPAAKELIGYNLAETIKLRDLSEALLGLAKQSAADTSKVDFNIDDVVSDAIHTIRPLADESQIHINYTPITASVLANRPAVTQILRILIDNAVKYSKPQSTVTIRASATQAGMSVDVTDEGIGISSEQQELIFDRFYRVDESRSSQNTTGNGLGLSIAKAVAERQGFTITVKSEENHGSTFTLHV